jgi:dihydroflavonol-4-reductase
MKVFVTGGSGFVGSGVVPALVRAGHRVRCLMRSSSDASRIRHVPWESVIGDVREADMVTAMRGCDAIIHLASLASWNDIASPQMDAVVYNGTRAILDAAHRLGNLRVVFVSSIVAINGSVTPRVFTENDVWTLNDRGLHYADAKRRAEALCRDYSERGVPVVVVNPGEVYGAGDTGFITAGNLLDFARSTPVFVCTGGTSVVHLDDVAAGIVAALERGVAGARYILSGDNVTIRQLAALTLDLLGRRAAIVSVPNALLRAVARVGAKVGFPLPFNPHVVPYATRFWYMDARRARQELGVSFRPARDTVAPVLDWLRQEGHL